MRQIKGSFLQTKQARRYSAQYAGLTRMELQNVNIRYLAQIPQELLQCHKILLWTDFTLRIFPVNQGNIRAKHLLHISRGIVTLSIYNNVFIIVKLGCQIHQESEYAARQTFCYVDYFHNQ